MAAKRRQQAHETAAEGQNLAASAPPPATQHTHSHQHGHQARDAQLVGLHRSKCWDWTPSAVVAMAACPESPMMAVGLESGDIQLWDMSFMACIQTVVGFAVEVTALAWAKDGLDGSWRTIAAALDGTIAEVNWKQGRLIGTSDSGAGAVWALSAQPASTVRPGFAHQIAAGCDDGSVRLFSVESGEPGVNYERTLTHVQGRVLALAWHPSGKSLLAGGADGCIHALDPNTGNESCRITAGASTSQPVCVWRLLVLPDGTIVSGDSGGAVQLWDAQFGTLLQRFAMYSADVLALAASPSGNHFWASGVDSKVTMFERCVTTHSSGRQEVARWVYTHHKRPHTHDVRALEVSTGVDGRPMLVSGAADAQLLVYPASSSFLSVHPARLTKAPQSPICKLATVTQQQQQSQQQRGKKAKAAAEVAAEVAMGRVLCAQGETVDVWQVGATVMSAGLQQQARTAEGQAVDLTAAPRHLTRICTRGAGRVAAADVSQDGSVVAVAAGPSASVRVYRLQEEGAAGAVAVRRVPLAGAVTGVTALCVSDQHVVTAHHTGKLRVHRLPDAQLQADAGGEQPLVHAAECSVQSAEDAATTSSRSVSQQQAGSWSSFQPHISRLCAAPDGSTLAAVSGRGVAFFKLTAAGSDGSSTMSLQQTGPAVKLPQDAPVTSLCFSPDSAHLAVTLASAQVVVLGVASRRPTDWTVQNTEGIAACVARLPGVPTGACFSCTGKQLLVHSAGGFCVMDLTRPVDVTSGSSRKRHRSAAKPQDGPQQVAGAGPVVDSMARGKPQAPQASGCNGKATLLRDPVVFVAFLGPRELLLLEKPWEDVLAALPPPLHRQRYGN